MSEPSPTVSQHSLWRDPREQEAGAGNGSPLVTLSLGDPRENIPHDPAILDRREFLAMMSASLGAMTLAGCRASQPPETIVPYRQSPEEIVPGRPLFFATAMSSGGRTTGILVESHMGRPTKIDGNPLHPASLGATDAITQAAVVALYDPDRSQAIRHLGEISTWSAFASDLREALKDQERTEGAGLRLLTGSVVSPTLARQIADLRRKYPKARWHRYDGGQGDAAREASRRLFGRPLDPVYRFDQAEIVVSLDADFLSRLNGSVRYSRDFSSRRDLVGSPGGMNRLYVAESSVSNTGAAADHRLPVAPSEVLSLAQRLARRTGIDADAASATPPALPAEMERWLDAVVADLEKRHGASLVLAGDRQPWPVHALAWLLNRHLENVGKTVDLIEPVEFEPVPQVDSLRELTEAIDAKEVEVLLIVDTNAAYTAPADLEFSKRLRSIPRLAAYLGEYEDETAELCHWHIPQTHFLESWGDSRAYDGTVTIAQPLIAPLFGGKSAHEFLSAAIDEMPISAYDAVRATWKEQLLADSETAWTKAVHDGIVPGTKHELVQVTERDGADLWTAVAAADSPSTTPAAAESKTFELVLETDPTIGDGRFANSGWLQELPKPWTRLTWGNAVLIAPAAAKELELREGDVVEVRAGERMIEGPVWIVPGHPAGSLTVHLGHGRRRGGKVATAHGFDAFPLRTTPHLSGTKGVQLRSTGRRERLACTQTHGTLEGRDEAIYRRLTFEDFAAGKTGETVHPHGSEGDAKGGESEHLPTLYPDYQYPERAWGMVIDLTRCTGCSACVVACQVENNVPVVGKPGVLIGREMHWLRIDRYFAGEPENPEILQQPMMCQHCEHAPCEVVCPVGATTHSSEGLNEMTYNRCVGTRYCSNNCPYKVRRFNFLRYTEDDSPLAKLRANPDVTVRTRGVMEKCTYCVQRINAARIEASTRAAYDGQPMTIADGAIETACQAVCPGQAIQFGDLRDTASRVAAWKSQPHAFGVLEELGIRPRTSYLARVTNPSPKISAPAPAPATNVHAEPEGRA